jgi:hypothetical protein
MAESEHELLASIKTMSGCRDIGKKLTDIGVGKSTDFTLTLSWKQISL